MAAARLLLALVLLCAFEAIAKRSQKEWDELVSNDKVGWLQRAEGGDLAS